MPRSELCTTQQVRLRPTSGRSPGDQGCTRARRVSDGAPSGGALCSSGLNLLAKLELVHLRIVGGALASEACERGDRGGAKARSRRSRSRVGGSELGRRGWWRGHRSVRRAACALLQKPRLGRAVVTAGGRIPPSIAPARPSGRRPSRDAGPMRTSADASSEDRQNDRQSQYWIHFNKGLTFNVPYEYSYCSAHVACNQPARGQSEARCLRTDGGADGGRYQSGAGECGGLVADPS